MPEVNLNSNVFSGKTLYQVTNAVLLLDAVAKSYKGNELSEDIV